MTIDFDRYEPESDRLRFMYERDGLDGVVEFAWNTRQGYRRHVVQGKCPKERRRSFIESYLAFKRFLEDTNNG